jgi:hypothetical protein
MQEWTSMIMMIDQGAITEYCCSLHPQHIYSGLIGLQILFLYKIYFLKKAKICGLFTIHVPLSIMVYNSKWMVSSFKKLSFKCLLRVK